jgi:DNA-binding Lrp family transcriptional regulator
VFKRAELLSPLDFETFPVDKECFKKKQTAEFPDLAGRIGQERHAPAEAALKDRFSAEEVGMIRQLQELFPLTDEPYRKISVDLGITEAQALERIKALLRKGCLKRIGSFSKPAQAIPEMKTLVAWQIPEEKLDRIGLEIAGFSEVFSADQRPAFSEFPYSLYTTIRAETPCELEVVARRMQDRIGKWPYHVFATTREFKKDKIKYFPKELDAWWRDNRHVVETEFNSGT